MVAYIGRLALEQVNQGLVVHKVNQKSIAADAVIPSK